MPGRFNHFLDDLSEFVVARKGLLPMLGIALVVLNLIVQYIPALESFAAHNVLLHLGVILAILGFLLAWAL